MHIDKIYTYTYVYTVDCACTFLYLSMNVGTYHTHQKAGSQYSRTKETVIFYCGTDFIYYTCIYSILF